MRNCSGSCFCLTQFNRKHFMAFPNHAFMQPCNSWSEEKQFLPQGFGVILLKGSLHLVLFSDHSSKWFVRVSVLTWHQCTISSFFYLANPSCPQKMTMLTPLFCHAHLAFLHKILRDLCAPRLNLEMNITLEVVNLFNCTFSCFQKLISLSVVSMIQ